MFAKLRKIPTGIFLLVIVLACSWPLLNPEMFFTHDFVHGARIAEMARALQDGHFPVRWSNNFGYGYGMPLFEFYAPLPFYVGTLAYLLGLPLVESVKFIFLLVSVLTVIGSYLLGKELYGKTGGLVVAAAITLAPYRALNLFIRGAISEVWGIAAAVWILYATLQVIKNGKKSAWILIVSLLGLFLSHNLLTMIFVPFAVLFTLAVLFFKPQYYQKRLTKTRFFLHRLVTIGLSYLTAIGIAAFYLFPSFFEKDYTQVEETITSQYFDYHLHFLYVRQFFRPGWAYGGSEWGPNDVISFFLGFGQLVGIALTVVVIGFTVFTAIRKKKVSTLAKPLLFTSIVVLLAGISLLFTLEKTLVVWESISLFKFIQFPWRFLSSAIIFLGILAGAWAVYVPAKYRYYLAVAVLVITLGVNWQYFRPEKYLEDSQALYYSDSTRIQKQMSAILQDYVPKTLMHDPLPPKSLVVCNSSDICENLQIVENKTHRKIIEIDEPDARFVTFSIADFPGWKAWLNGKEAAHLMTEDGLIQLQLPQPGKYTIKLEFTATPLRYWSDRMSLVTLITAIVYFSITLRKQKHKVN